MKLFVDADGCPVINIAIARGRARGVPVILVCDTAHEFERAGAETVTVSKGADSADFKLANLIGPGDIAVTQDYGLAAMCLARGARALNQDGMEYTGDNIDALLLARHTARKIRMGGGRLKGPAKREKRQDQAFREALERMLASSSPKE